MRSTAPKLIICTILILSAAQILWGQGWKRTYDFNNTDDFAKTVLQTNDGGYLLVGNKIVKTNSLGEIEWTRETEGLPITVNIGEKKAALFPDGSFVVATVDNTPYGCALTKYSNSGVLLWTKTYSPPSLNGIYECSVAIFSDESIVANFTYKDVSADEDKILIIKVNSEGELIWQQDYGVSNSSQLYPTTLTALTDGSFIMAGNVSEAEYGAFLTKFEQDGAIAWYKIFPSDTSGTKFNSVIETADHKLIIAGYDFNSNMGFRPLLAKLNIDGEEIWYNTYEGYMGRIYSIVEIPNKGFSAAGYSEGGGVAGGTNWLFDTNGNEISRNVLTVQSNQINTFECYSIVQTNDAGFAIGGVDYNDFSDNMLLLKTDSLGNIYSHYIAGNAYRDQNTNCSPDNEPGLQKFIVKAVGEETFYAITDTAGYYAILIDTGTYEVSIVPTTYWQTCEPSYTIAATTLFDTTTQNFPLQPMIDCPLMEVSIGTPFLRICSERAYSVSYCNHGTVNAESVTVQVTLDPNLQYLSATAPLVSQNGQVLLFDVGDVALNECGAFQVSCMLGCDTALIGETLCSEAHIFPDSICENTWTGANLMANGLCQNDSIRFSIFNTGGDMPQAHEYIVIEDNIILRSEIFQLPGNETLNIDVEAQPGATYFLLAAQDPNLPPIFGNPTATAVVEGCVGLVNPGAFNQFPQDDGEPWLDIDCHEVVASFDPNDKSAVPTGWQDEHFIDENTQLDYLIRFQNTGTDTAFRVVLIDTLSSFLDPVTIRPGASSHPYTFELSGQGVAKFIFNNILLPDSTTNEAASHGFVQFHIAQKPDNQPGTVIENTAGIYFDYNAPVYTNTTFHTIREPWVGVLSGSFETTKAEMAVKVSPNPMGDWAIFELLKPLPGENTLILWDALGKEVLRNNLTNGKALLQREGMAPGLYFFSIENNGEKVGAGKLIVK